jgi:hypothetical protein
VRVFVVVLLVVLLPNVSRAQKRPCTVAAGAEAIEPSSFPDKAWAEQALSMWRRTLRDPRLLAYQDAVAFGSVLPYNYTAAPLWAPVTGLPPQAFVAMDRKRLIPVLSAEPRSGPLRIVFVVENGRRVTVAERQVEIAAMKAILSVAPRKDSFAFLSTASPRVAVPFGSSRQAIKLALEGLRQPAHKGPQGEKVSGAILEAAQSFGTPQEGDAIILLARTMDGSQRAEVSSALTGRGIRLFSLGLGTMVETGWASFGEGYSINSLATLSEETGGGWEQIGPLANKDRVTGTKLHVARKYARKLYEMATTYYTLCLERTGPHVVIGLSPHTLDQTPWGRVVYPKPLPVCP